MPALPQHIHPMVVHFPIALFFTALFFEVFSWVFKNKGLHTTALYLYVAAALLTPLVVLTGLREAQRLNLHHHILTEHRAYALWTMWSTLVSLPFLGFFAVKYPKIFRVFFILCLLNAAVLVTLTGHVGGEMVFNYGVGTDLF